MICKFGTTEERALALAQTQADLTGFTFLVANLLGHWHIVPAHTEGFDLPSAQRVTPGDGTERLHLSKLVLCTEK